MLEPVTCSTARSARLARRLNSRVAVGVGKDIGPVTVRQHRRARKFRSIGKHTAPSQLEVAAQKAGKAVPAAAVVGALAVTTFHSQTSARPLSFAAVTSNIISSKVDAVVPPTGPLGATTMAETVRPDHLVVAAAASLHRTRSATARTYTVGPGDTLSGIAFRFYGSARAWEWLYLVNREKIRNPNQIVPGWVLWVPRDIPARFRGTGADVNSTGKQHAVAGSSGTIQPRTISAFQGTLGCSALETLWRSAGGAPSAQVTAASIAMAESSGIQYATGPYGERGYWQINPDHGALSTYDAYGNARAAIMISDDGTNWSPWTTFVDGAYRGRC
jgi:hypothetical protein